MKKSKLMSLLSKLENYETNPDFVSISDSFAMRLRGGYGDTNSACSGNSLCTNNESCQGNASCSANAACTSNTGCENC